MQPNLKLVTPSSPAEMPSGKNTAPVVASPLARNLVLHPLVPIAAHAVHASPRANKHQAKPAYYLLAAVTGIHLAAIAGLLSAAATPAALQLKAELSTIRVSLISPPAAKPLPTLAPAEKPKAKPAAKPIAQTKAAKIEPVKTEIATTKTVTTRPETSVAPTPTAVKTDLALLIASTETPAAASTPEESLVEPPSFAAAYLQNPAPEYPQLSRRMGEQGRVLLRVLVSSNGVADRVKIETSSGSSKLDEAALRAVEKWNFVPAKRSNQPVSAYVLVPVKFSLNS